MNIITIKTGQFYDPEYAEYVFKTTKNRREIFDENLNLTPLFIVFLKEYHYDNLLHQYYHNRQYFEIDFYYEDNIDEVIF